MKKIILVAFLAITAIAFAQKQEFKESIGDIEKVVIESETKINIVATNTTDLVISKPKKSSKDNIYWSLENDREESRKRRDDKRRGLTAIYPGGKDNTNGFGFAITRDGSTLLVKDLKSHFQRKEVQISLPKSVKVSVFCNELGSVSLEGFSSEVEVETQVGKINMKKVTGPITAHSSVGAIAIDFTDVNQTSPITISSSVSEIDVTLPASTKASLDMKTNGTVYTNFNLKASAKEGLKDVSNKEIKGDINNGGVKIKLKSSMGNIYLRKK